MSTNAESLRSVPLFADLSKRDLKRLVGSMHEKSFASGEEVVTEGDRGIGFFVILDGRARVTRHGEDRGTLSAGDYFGEMALIDGDDRSATIIADGDLHCAAMTSWHFRPLVREHPDIAWSLLTALVKRVRAERAQQVGAAG